MENNAYLDRLSSAMKEQGAPEEAVGKCCAYARHLLEKGLPVLFDGYHVDGVLRLRGLHLYAYHTFAIEQIGKRRTITAPSLELKRRQRWILQQILEGQEISPHAHGFVMGRSIRTNALAHAAQEYAMCLDVQDFFPSIRQEQVKSVFRELGYSPRAASRLAEVCCFQGCLPQGAPTSPCLSNIVFRPVDEKLAEIAEAEGVTYTRYADDMTFSADRSLEPLLPQIKAVLQEAGFRLNAGKTKLYGPGQPKRITGLTVQNGQIRVPKQFKRALRQEIHYCTKFGVQTHLENTGAEHSIHYREHLYGKAYFVYMIEPEMGRRFLEQLDRISWLG